MMSNSTLMDTCKSLGISAAASANSNTGSKSSSSSKSAGVSVSPMAGGQIFALVSVFVYALAML